MQKRGTMQKHSSSFPFCLCRNTPPLIARALACINCLIHRCRGARPPRSRSLHRRRARPLPPRLRQFLLSEEKLPWRADFEQKSSIAPRRRTNVRREEASEDRKGNIIKLAESQRLSTLNENQTTKMQKRGTMQKHSSSFPFRLCRNTPPPIKKASSSYPPHISPYAHGLRRQRRDGCRHGSNGHGDHSAPPWCRSEHRGPDRRDEGRRC